MFYQLRRLWQLGRELIEQFVADLARQQEERERRAHLAEHNRRQFARRQELEARLNAAQDRGLGARDQQLSTIECSVARLTRFWHYFKRRACARQRDAARVAVGGRRSCDERRAQQSTTLSSRSRSRNSRGCRSKRGAPSISTAIAYAEVLCMRLSRTTPLVALRARGHRAARGRATNTARARVRGAHGARSSARARCIQSRTNIAQEVKERSERLRKIARYRNATDTVPTSDSIAFAEGDVLRQPAAGASAASMPNVLAEDTWDLFRVLLR